MLIAAATIFETNLHRESQKSTNQFTLKWHNAML